MRLRDHLPLLRSHARTAVPGMPPGVIRWIRRHRRSLAMCCVVLAVLATVQAARPAAISGVPVLVAARDLRPGDTLVDGDLRMADYPLALVPAAAFDGPLPIGERVLVAVGAGEPLTGTKLLSRSALEQYGPDVVAVPVRLADAGAAALISTGSIIDIIASSPASESGTPARVVASNVRVLIPATSGDQGVLGSEVGSLIVVVTTPQVATELAAAAATSRLSPVLR